MILTIDIGNTNTVLGCWQGEKLILTVRLHTNRDQTADEYCLLVAGLLKNRGIAPSGISGGILSSVVPELKKVMKDAMELMTGRSFLCVGAGLKTGLNIRMDNPAQLGADLVVDAVAALAKYPPPLVIFDMGTATTMSVIDPTGAYLGGMIIPGLRLSVDALSARAAQLPYIHLGPPERFIGSNTIDCMQVFREAYLVAGSYPHESMYLLQHLFNNWFVNLELDKMAAAAVCVGTVLFIFILLLQRFWDKDGKEA